MDEDMLTDITLDHLPDLSDASVSFQIPVHDASADLLADHTGFDLLCRASDSDQSFAPVNPRHHRGPPLTLSELTPRVHPTSRLPPSSQSPTPTTPSPSANPTIIRPPLTLGHRSPRKLRQTASTHLQVARALVSEERLDQLRAQVETLRQPDDPSHGFPDDPTPSSPNSQWSANISARPSEDPPREQDASLGTQASAPRDVVSRDNAPSDATDSALPTPRPRSSRNPRTIAKPTVVAGGISKRAPFPTTHVSKKTKNKTTRMQEAHNVPLATPHQPDPPQLITIEALQELVPPANSSGDTDVKSENTLIAHPGTSGLAERLVSYSQRLISSIGLYKPYSESSCAEDSADAVRGADICVESRTPATATPLPPPQTMNDMASVRNEPLRLSEVSPRKPPLNAPQPSSPVHIGILQDGRCAVSPTHLPKKRATTDADAAQDNHRRKRGKTVAADADFERGSSNEALSQDQGQGHSSAQVDHEAITQGSTVDTARHLDFHSTLPNARTKYKPRFDFTSGCKGPTLDPFPYLSRSRQVRRSMQGSKRGDGQSNPTSRSERRTVHCSTRLRCDKQTRNENAVRSCHAQVSSGTGDLPMIEKQNATLCMAPLTKPVGFTFRVDARMERREGRLAASEPGRLKAAGCEAEPKPFVSLHGHPPAFVPKHVPVPVLPFYFCTEQRARERDKFDAMVKRKEEEAERLREEERGRAAEAEEQAIKVLRRKAVPKANAIPEWYADMPKKRPVV